MGISAVALRDLSFIRGGGEGWCKWGEGHYILCNQKGEGHQKFKQGFGEGHIFVVNIAVHLK